MRGLVFSILLSLCIISIAGRAFSQGTNSTGPNKWPSNPPVGIGTVFSGADGAQNALHINNDSSSNPLLEATLRLSNGGVTPSNTFGILGLMPPSLDASFSSLSRAQDLILHEHQGGDIIITNFWPGTALTHQTGGSIRLATAGDTMPGSIPNDSTLWRKDYERLTIGINGNIGFDLPPTATGVDTGLDTVLDQVQIGGGSVAPSGELDPLPGLTIYGGNRWEGLPVKDTSGIVGPLGHDTFPVDWRYINFNSYVDHSDPSSSRSKRFARTASSGISFSDVEEGTLQLSAEPYDASHSNNENQRMTLNLTGEYGLSLWQFNNDSSQQYRHFFDVYPPGIFPVPNVTRNTNGLTYFHTPMYIGCDSAGDNLADFQNLPVKPDIGDGITWTLVVDGPVLAKEIFVLDSTWADYVFDPSYNLPPLGEVENYIKRNHHLPDIPPASKIAKSGIPVGRTEEALTKQMEEMMLYTIELKKEVEALKAQVQDLKSQKEK